MCEKRQKVHTELFHFYETQEHVNPVYGANSQNGSRDFPYIKGA